MTEKTTLKNTEAGTCETGKKRLIGDLLGKAPKVYIYIKNEKMFREFARQAEAEGINFGDGIKVADKPFDDILALNPDRTLCYVGFNGHLGFHHPEEFKNILRVDYPLYISGCEKYTYTPQGKPFENVEFPK